MIFHLCTLGQEELTVNGSVNFNELAYVAALTKLIRIQRESLDLHNSGVLNSMLCEDRVFLAIYLIQCMFLPFTFRCSNLSIRNRFERGI